MERNFSVDDLVGGIFRLQNSGGFHRTDSEAAFQEFLKRIPSATNLAAADLSGSAAQLQFQFTQQAAASTANPSTVAAVVPPAPVVDVHSVSAAGVGLPRVPSLDFLRQLASVQHQIASTNGGALIKVENQSTMPQGLSVPGFSPADLANLNASMALTSALQAVPSLNTAVPHMAMQSAAAAAAAMQANQQQQQQHQFSRNNSHIGAAAAQSNGPAMSEPSSPSSNEKDGDKGDVRKARSRTNRMLSNRESARRSRRRKQEHLSKLEQEINVMVEEKRAWTDQATSLERRCSSVDDENRRLKEENERLRDELQFLRSELKERNSFARRGDQQEDEEEEDPSARNNKRQRADGKEAAAGGAAQE